MAKFSHYIDVGAKKLRCGYTTGTCATAGATASAMAIISGEFCDVVSIMTPAGIEVHAEVLQMVLDHDTASCAICKDGGDDPDITDGELICVTVRKCAMHGIFIDGGAGVGRVTKAGLDQKVGMAAINSTPRSMIEKSLLPMIKGKNFGFEVVISVPNGKALAKRTFNPRLGIVGGISILGTSGIVRPMSEAALIDSVRLEIRTIRATGTRNLILTPGNYGEDFLQNEVKLCMKNVAICSNYLGEAIDCAILEGFETILYVGHFGKLAKVSAGCMNTHSKIADGRREAICTHAAMCGAQAELVRELYNCIATDSAVDLLTEHGILEQTMASMSSALEDNLMHRAGGTEIASLFFSKKFGVLGKTSLADKLIALHTF